MPRLCAEGLEKTWDAGGPAPVRALQSVSFAVEPGETVIVSGPSGSGKTTLLAILGGLLRPEAGAVWLDGRNLVAASETERTALRLGAIGFVFQRGLLLDHLTALQNVAVVPRGAGVARHEARARAAALLERVGLGARAETRGEALSAGERQRVALARALVMRPRLVLADEPTAHLDWASGAQVVEVLRALGRDAGAALVIVTHDPRLAPLGDRVLRLDDGRLAAT